MIDLDNLDNILKLKSIETPLDNIYKFITEKGPITIAEMDHYTVFGLNLFQLDLNFDFLKLSEVLSNIKKVNSNVKRIFSHPIIELKDDSDILPVESVRIVNAATIRHLGSHTENVTDIKNGKIKPEKLLTRIYEDNYSIYENIVFCNFVDDVISYLKRNIKHLQELIYTSEVKEINLNEKLNHLNYFLALGKLQTSYIGVFNKYYKVSKKNINDLKEELALYKSRLKTNIYLKNRNRNRNLKLHKTNIFLHQKDYHKVYMTYKYLKHDVLSDLDNVSFDAKKFERNYFLFLKLLTVFSINHFNFETDVKEKIDFFNLNCNFKFKDFSLNVKEFKDVLILTFKKDIAYQIILKPEIIKKNTKNFKSKENVYEVFVTPYDKDIIESDKIQVSIDNIDSFRRLSTLILRGMVYSDKKRNICPFCGDMLVYNKEDDSYVCEVCETYIKEDLCSEVNKKYYFTKINNFKTKFESFLRRDEDSKWEYDRRLESSLYYRNITRVDEEGSPICPYCNKVHIK